MKKATGWGAALAGLAIAGCSAGDPGSAGADLAYVDEASIESRGDLFIDPTISWRPMTETQLGLLGGAVDGAIPVTVEVFEGVAVAWIRTEAADATRSREDIVGLFRVVEHATATRDETYREGEEVVYTPPETFGGQLEGDTQTGLHVTNPEGDVALIDWIDLSRFPPEDDAALWRELGESHPGCLE